MTNSAKNGLWFTAFLGAGSVGFGKWVHNGGAGVFLFFAVMCVLVFFEENK